MGKNKVTSIKISHKNFCIFPKFNSVHESSENKKMYQIYVKFGKSIVTGGESNKIEIIGESDESREWSL